MKTIGVLGGMGPQATMAFEQALHRAAQRHLPIRNNEGYPPLVSVFVRHAPVAIGADGRPSDPLTLDPRLLDAARRLGTWADVVAIPSNTPHFFLEEIAAAAEAEVVSIVDVTLAEVQSRGLGRVGLLGLKIPKVYAVRLEESGVAPIVAPTERRDALDDAILRLMEGRNDESHAAAARAALEAVRAQGAVATILGCTEIPLLLEDDASAEDLIDPGALLAEATLLRAIA